MPLLCDLTRVIILSTAWQALSTQTCTFLCMFLLCVGSSLSA